MGLRKRIVGGDAFNSFFEKEMKKERYLSYVYMYDATNGELLKFFDSINSASTWLRLCDEFSFMEDKVIKSRLRKALINTGVVACGYLWSYQKKENYYDAKNDISPQSVARAERKKRQEERERKEQERKKWE